MLLVNLVLHGLEMCSDLGIGPALIQHKRGEEPDYLRTAWTLGLLRSLALWATAVALAWPLATLYGEPRLIAVLPVAALSLLLDSLCSGHVTVLERRLQFRFLTLISAVSYTVSVAIMITGALYTTTVWPLVAGALVNAALSSALTHLLPGATPMRFQINPQIAKQLMTFGRWITLSSLLTFTTSQLDKILLGKLLTVTELGVYAIAFMMAQVTVSLMHELCSGVLRPVYARAGETSPQLLRAQVKRYRIALLLLTAPPLLLLYIIGPELMHLLYDDRYSDAGWMVQILAVGALVSIVLMPAESVLIARGDSYHHMLLQGIAAIAMATCIATGYTLAGTPGLLIGYALSGLLRYPFLAAYIQPHNVWLPKLDLAAVTTLALLLATALLLRENHLLPWQ
jgi:O-antigen/teichoic acid export membrane protein